MGSGVLVEWFPKAMPSAAMAVPKTESNSGFKAEAEASTEDGRDDVAPSAMVADLAAGCDATFRRPGPPPP
jgi:hypothetical protein